MLWLKELSHTHCMSMRCNTVIYVMRYNEHDRFICIFATLILKNYEKVKQHQCQQLLTKDEIAIQLHTYLQKYAPMITWLEEQSMVKDLWQFRLAYTTAEKTPSTYYRCENITNTLYWRHLNLRALIYDVAYWQLEPILFHWEIIGSCLWYHNGRVFLKLHFQTLL